MASVEEALGRARAVASLSLHRSTYVPNGHQEASITKEEVQSLLEQRRQLDIDLQRSQHSGSVLPELLDLRQALDTQIALRNALLAPCRMLPPELLSEIFLLALPDIWDHEPAGVRRLNVARVCSSWRTTALATPRIWNTLRFNACDNPLNNHAAAVATEMKKAGNAPLSIIIDALLPEEWVFRNRMVAEDFWGDEAWNILCSASQRWCKVTLRGVPRSAYDILTQHDFPLLHSLSLSLAPDGNTPVEVPLHVFQNAPNITSLSIQYYSPPVEPVLPSSWKITELTITCGEHGTGRIFTPPLAPSLAVIKACSQTLRKCTVTANESGPFNPSHSRISLPALEELRLSGSAISLCRFVSAPKLTTAALRSYPDLIIDILATFRVLMDHSRGCPSLRSFAILESFIWPIRLLAFLMFAPQITDLHLSFDDTPQQHILPTETLLHMETLGALSRDGGSVTALTLLPNLRRLHLELRGVGEDTEEKDREYREAVQNIFESRRYPRVMEGTPLACLEKLTDSKGLLLE
ncbi:uncharacterized protein SCHCODRAFT_02615814 [Schizophyllum commune H4-8]|nr:uncharacterized protein SCHCODRAFT_02615814 [Schizophyllum commune H4-8]KAI5896782.1 hypothetical protein SCHCODRAFT_02615814 [Schizophyllum commune H4-8]